MHPHAAEPHAAPASGEAHGHAGPSSRAYLVVFGALIVFTLISFVVNSVVRAGHLAPHTGFAIILGVAVCKAVLVGAYFMHLILDWGRFYFIIIPVGILGALLVVVLLPDIVLAWHHPVIP